MAASSAWHVTNRSLPLHCPLVLPLPFVRTSLLCLVSQLCECYLLGSPFAWDIVYEPGLSLDFSLGSFSGYAFVLVCLWESAFSFYIFETSAHKEHLFWLSLPCSAQNNPLHFPHLRSTEESPNNRPCFWHLPSQLIKCLVKSLLSQKCLLWLE